MREDGVGQQEVKRPAERRQREGPVVAERGPLEGEEFLAELLPDALVEEPLLGFDPDVPPGAQIDDEQTARAERPAPDVEEGVVLA